jgi:hypothetical protein
MAYSLISKAPIINALFCFITYKIIEDQTTVSTPDQIHGAMLRFYEANYRLYGRYNPAQDPVIKDLIKAKRRGERRSGRLKKQAKAIKFPWMKRLFQIQEHVIQHWLLI